MGERVMGVDVTEYFRMYLSLLVDTWKLYSIITTLNPQLTCRSYMEFECILLSPFLVWSTTRGLPRRCGICRHQHSTSGIKWRIRIEIKMWHSTYWHMTQCEGVGWLLWWFALMTNIGDIRERNVTIRNEIWNYEHPFPRVSGDMGEWVMGIDVMEFRVYLSLLVDTWKLYSIITTLNPQLTCRSYMTEQLWGFEKHLQAASRLG